MNDINLFNLIIIAFINLILSFVGTINTQCFGRNAYNSYLLGYIDRIRCGILAFISWHFQLNNFQYILRVISVHFVW